MTSTHEPRTAVEDLQDIVLRLMDRVRTLEFYLGLRRIGESGFEELTDQPVAPSLRTRRVVVVDEAGVEKAEVTASHGGGMFAAVGDGDLERHTTKVEVGGNNDDSPSVGLWMFAYGNILADMTLNTDGEGNVETYLMLERCTCHHGWGQKHAELRGDGVSMMSGQQPCPRCAGDT